MAYGQAWDETAPAGASTPANTIDTVIQGLKIAIRERIEDLVPDWDDDGVDPKVLAEGSTRIFVDTAANRPATPTAEGHIYLESDTNELYYGVSGAWVRIGTTVDSARVATPESDGHVHMDPATGIIGVDDGAGVWADLSAARAVYDQTLGAGNRVTLEESLGPKRVLHMLITGTSTATVSTTATIDLDELAGSYHVDNLVGAVVFPAGAAIGTGPMNADWMIQSLTRLSSANNTLTLNFYDFTGGATQLGNWAVSVILWFSA